LIKLCESLGIDLSTDIMGDGTKSPLSPRKKSRWKSIQKCLSPWVRGPKNSCFYVEYKL